MDTLFSVLQFTLEFQVFPFDTFLKEDSDKLSGFSFKYNIKISFYATPLDASLKFFMSHHLCSIQGGWNKMKRMFSSEEDCSRMKKLTGIYDVFQKKEGKSKDWEDSAPVGVSPARDSAHE